MTILTGVFRIGRDVEVRQMSNGDAVANISLAYNYGRKDESGNRPTQWVDAALFGKRAESLAQYLIKGSQIWAVIGEVRIEEFKRGDGSLGSKLVGTISDVGFVGSREQGQQQAPQQRQAAPARQPAQRQAPHRQAEQGLADMDDDIPF